MSWDTFWNELCTQVNAAVVAWGNKHISAVFTLANQVGSREAYGINTFCHTTL